MLGILLPCMLLAALPGQAQELRLHGGAAHATPQSETTYSWAVEYRQALSQRFSASFSWLNEGHLRRHHRDGQAVQAWWHAPLAGRWRFDAGLGPYHYYDTVKRANAAGYANDHGWGLLASIGLTAFHANGWTSSLRLNRVQVPSGHHSTGLVAGLGTRFGPAPDDARVKVAASDLWAKAGEMEVALMLGRSVVNSFSSPRAVAKGIGLRWRAGNTLTFGLGYIDEGRLDGGAWRGRRTGLAPQLWLEKDLTQSLVVGVGLGPYIALEKPDGAGASRRSTISSVTAGYRFAPDWIGRLTWNRIATDYSGDTDVVLFGLGRRF